MLGALAGRDTTGTLERILTVVGTWPRAPTHACQMSLDSCGYTLSPTTFIVVLDTSLDYSAITGQGTALARRRAIRSACEEGDAEDERPRAVRRGSLAAIITREYTKVLTPDAPPSDHLFFGHTARSSRSWCCRGTSPWVSLHPLLQTLADFVICQIRC